MSHRSILSLSAVLGLALCTAGARAISLSGTLVVDNFFSAYVSTDPTVLGTLVASGNNWFANPPVSFTGFSLTAGQTYYLQIVGGNEGGPAGFLGNLRLAIATLYLQMERRVS